MIFFKRGVALVFTLVKVHTVCPPTHKSWPSELKTSAILRAYLAFSRSPCRSPTDNNYYVINNETDLCIKDFAVVRLSQVQGALMTIHSSKMHARGQLTAAKAMSCMALI